MFLIYVSEQIDRQTYRLIAILCTFTEGELIFYDIQCGGIGSTNSGQVERHGLCNYNEVIFEPTFKGSYCRRSFNSDRDFMPYLGWTVAEGTLNKLGNHTLSKLRGITACTVVQAVVKATSQSNGKGQILTPWGSETPKRISMKLGIYNWVAGMPTHANSCGAATTWVVWANTWKTPVVVS